MNKIFRTLMATAVAASLIVGGGAAWAQTTPDGQQPPAQTQSQGQKQKQRGMRGGSPLHRLAGQLGLTDAQKQQIQPIMQRFAEQAKTRHQAYETRFRSILTAEQQAQFDQMKAQRGQRKAQGEARGQRGQKGEGGRLASLNLTDAQKTQMQALRQEARTEMQATFQQFVAEINPILTAEQQATLQGALQKWQEKAASRQRS